MDPVLFQFPGVAWPDHWSKQLATRNVCALTLNLLTTTIVAPPSNASKWQMGFNSAFKRLILATMEKVVVSVRDITKMKESLYLSVIYELRATSDASILTIFTRGGYKYCDVTLMREFGWQLISRRQPPNPPAPRHCVTKLPHFPDAEAALVQ